MTVPDSSPMAEQPLRPVEYRCGCGYRLVGQANDVPRYCARCGTPVHRGIADDLGRIQVLVVEDNALLRRTVARMLGNMGCEVAEAADGEEALAAMRSRRPDLLLTDLVMPKMDGIEMLQHLRRDEQLREIPVVILSARSDARIMAEAMAGDVLAYIAKGQVGPSELNHLLRQCLIGVNKLIAQSTRTRVLVVEDSSLLKIAFARMLRTMGCEVAVAADGEEALAAIRDRCPDLVITDIIMPKMDGIELLKAIRREEQACDIPVIMLTCKNDAEVMAEAMAEGVLAYILKESTDPEDLKRQIRRQLIMHAPFLSFMPDLATVTVAEQ